MASPSHNATHSVYIDISNVTAALALHGFSDCPKALLFNVCSLVCLCLVMTCVLVMIIRFCLLYPVSVCTQVVYILHVWVLNHNSV